MEVSLIVLAALNLAATVANIVLSHRAHQSYAQVARLLMQARRR